MVIIEVARSFTRWEAVLGEHRWREVFQNPAPEHQNRVSQIFYCTKNTGRMVQKSGEIIATEVSHVLSRRIVTTGWKRVYIEESWFVGWSPINKCVLIPLHDLWLTYLFLQD